MNVSIIIPTYNESAGIGKLISYLKQNGAVEIIVADGNSTDNTPAIAWQAGATAIHSLVKGRGAQMNEGARKATGDVFYFLHADSYPPPGFIQDIQDAVNKGFGSGCYRLSFDYKHWFLKFNCWFTRFNINAVRFGDQSLFVSKEVFTKTGGFREDLIVMEDQEIIARIKKHTRFIVFSKAVTTSARKYLDNGIYKLQGVFFIIYFLYQLGFSQKQLVKTYRLLIRQDKM